MTDKFGRKKALEQKPKTGHWIQKEDWYCEYFKCSVCGELFCFIDGTPGMYNYCPNCGSRMSEPQESEGDGE